MKNTKLLCTLALNLGIAATTHLLGTSTARANAGDLFATDPVAGSVIVYTLDGTMRTFATGLALPQGITFDSNGNLYVADEGAGKIYQFAADGTRVTLASGLNKPVGLTFDGKLLTVAQQGKNQITHIDIQGNSSIFHIVTKPVDVQAAPPDAPTPSATPDPTLPQICFLNATDLTSIDGNGQASVYPNLVTEGRGLAIDGTGNIFASSDTGTITEVPIGSAVGVPFASGLTTPGGMAFRAKWYSDTTQGVGNLFVAETDAGRVSQFTTTGVQSTFATGGHPKYLAFERILPGKLLNISTRAEVKTGDDVLIGGFIITGTGTKTVILRGLGPSLGTETPPVSGALGDPILELHKPDGSVLTNDNWKSNTTANQTIITNNHFDKVNGMSDGQEIADDESIIVASGLAPGNYTVILRGVNASTGVALVEAYDLADPATSTSEFGNISTRGFVESGDNVMIGGFIVQPNEAARILVRAIGPELTTGTPAVPNALADPTLDLMDGDGNVIRSNNNWQDVATAAGEIAVTGVAPTNDKEPAILANLVGGNYTAIVRGENGGSGVALVEVYHLP